MLKGRLIVAPSGAVGVAVVAQVVVILFFSFEGLRVGGNDGDLVPISRADAVGWESEQRRLELRIRP